MRNKLSLVLIVIATITVLPVMGKNNNAQDDLSKITLQLQAEEWVSTNAANVTIGIDATLDRSGIAQMRSEIMRKLTKIGNGDWHITRFEQTRNESGLEQVQALAESRLPESVLAGLRDTAKSISKPGFNFKVVNIDFTPTPDEIENSRINLRNKIYNQAKAEISRLNKVYPGQNYYLYTIDFLHPITPAPMANVAYMARAAGNGDANSNRSLMVSNKVRVIATIEIAAIPAIRGAKINN